MYLPKNKLVADKQLAVRELVVEYADHGIYTAATAVNTIEMGEAVSRVVSVIHVDISAVTALPVVAGSISISGTTIVVTTPAAMAAGDCMIVRYAI